jgi:hypothetical protein
MEQQSRDAGVLTGFLPSPAEVLDLLSIPTGENVIVRLLVRYASSEELKNALCQFEGCCDFRFLQVFLSN